jgi:vibriolysin
MKAKKLTFTLCLILCFLMAISSWAARKVEFTQGNTYGYLQKLNNQAMKEALGLSQDDGFKLVRTLTDENGITHYRYQQTYKGFPVWGLQTLIGKDNDKAISLHGTIALDARNDIGSIPGSLNPLAALNRQEELHKAKDPAAPWNFRNEQYGTYVYIDAKDKAHLCFVVSFFADTDCGSPSRPVFFIDVKNGKILHSFDSLAYAYDGTGPGGNQKIGQYYYGTDYSKFGVAIAGSTCTMNWADCKTVDLNHGTAGTTPYSYTCYNNTHENINGAYCPLNDAQFFGQQIYNMYMAWYSVPVLPFQLMMRCHYSTNYENAFWDGSSMTFGDGFTTFYPLVSLDVSAHEVAHGFTENHSGLIYSSQSGGINESYSDMAGEAAKYYLRGTNDFMCGFDIYKNPTQALRYLCNPPQDGVSIDHVGEYYEGLDVHYSSGIFNKAFCLIAQSSGWTTRKAFDIFTRANMVYWIPGSTFQQGAEGVMNAAVDLGYPCQDVVNAFAVVGITLVCPGPPTADFSAYPLSGGVPLTPTFTDLSLGPTSWSWQFGDGGTSTLENPTHTYNSMGTFTVTLTVVNPFGSDVEVKTNYITVTAPQPPVANFIAGATDLNIGSSVTFTDTSLENPTSWSWTFPGGTPGTSTAKDPTVQYNTVGTFDVTLVVANPQGSDTETKVGYIMVSNRIYCSSWGESQVDEYIGGVTVENLENTSGPSPYSDFTAMTANLVRGRSAGFFLYPEYPYGSYPEWWKIWIDYNDDHDFEDAGEEVYSDYDSDVMAGTFTVPLDTIIGNTRMRISMKYGTPPTPCEDFSSGEVEDYTVNIRDSGGNQLPTANYTFTTNYLTAYFTDTSTDPDGTIVGWAWNFGDNQTSTQQNPTHTYAAAGTYMALLTVTDDDGETGSVSKPVTVTAPVVKMYVYNITQTITKTNNKYKSTAVVTMKNTNNALVANAAVYIAWSGVVSGSTSGITNANGTVTFTSAQVNNKTGPFTITVTNATHATYVYDSSLNIETSDTAYY